MKSWRTTNQKGGGILFLLVHVTCFLYATAWRNPWQPLPFFRDVVRRQRRQPRSFPSLGLQKWRGVQSLLFRGGGSGSNSKNEPSKGHQQTMDQEPMDSFLETKNDGTIGEEEMKMIKNTSSSPQQLQPPSTVNTTTTTPNPIPNHKRPARTVKFRHSSDMIHSLIPSRSRSGSVVDVVESSLELRRLIATRAEDYRADLLEAAQDETEKLPHPRKLLHYLAPKVPAIQHSPDVTLKIHSARSSIDSGIAACIIGTLAQVCEMYDKEVMKRMASTTTSRRSDDSSSTSSGGGDDDDDRPRSVAPKITTDRRFEQLVECVLSGVNVPKRKEESFLKELDIERQNQQDTTADIEELLDEENVQEDAGLNARDACRAAWGIAVLGAFHWETLGGENVMDLLLSLSLRIREILLARLQVLRRADLWSESPSATSPHQTTEGRLHELAEELAEDAVFAMWAFGCVKACTGMRSAPLFETCASLLCQDPVDLRKRAQEEEQGLENANNIGNNDVVDRLARSVALEESEADESSSNSTTTTTTTTAAATTRGANGEEEIDIIDPKDALLDYLSPNLVNDVLWALALHGSTDSKTTEEITLSETATTLREYAFDRLMECLEEDLSLLQSLDNRNEKEEEQQEDAPPPLTVSIPTTEQAVGPDTLTVEVVDAAALLKSRDEEQTDFVEDVPIENLTIRKGRHSASGFGGGDVQEVQVVDAAKLLASIEEGGSVEVETEVIMAPSALVESGSSSSSNSTNGESSSMAFQANNAVATESTNGDKEVDVIPFNHQPPVPFFSPRDLCCSAWSVTELVDQLRPQIVGLVTRIFALLGPTSTDQLKGTDLANLAWAIAKNSEEVAESSELFHHSVSIVRWIARSSSQRLMDASSDSKTYSNTWHTFQPPELGRLLWAIACTISTDTELCNDARRDAAVTELALVALLAAGSNLSMFTTEDLLRISWAFLELCDTTEVMGNPKVAMALGGVLATVEASLDEWQRGRCRNAHVEIEPTDATFTRFSSFFGKPRLNLRYLDRPIGNYEDEDEAEMALLLEKSHLPMLRDLSIDPSTLCKAACGFARLSSHHPYLKGSWALTQAAVKLLSSKNARLMKECSIHDIVRICEAAALNEMSGHGRELVSGLFARKVVELLNEALDTNADPAQTLEVNLSDASPSEIVSLYWSLGELGVRHSLSDDHRHSAYKRLRLVSEQPLLDKHQVQSLTGASSIRLLCALVAMKYSSSDRRFLLDVALDVQKKVDDLGTGQVLCELAESLAAIREVVMPGATYKENMANSKKREDVKVDTNATSIEQDEPPDDSNDQTEDFDSPLVIDDASIDEELVGACEDLLHRCAFLAMHKMDTLSASELRRLLTVYALLPFQSDDLIEIIKIEIATRKERLQSASTETSMVDLMEEAATMSISVNTTLFGNTHGESRMDAIRKGIKSFFFTSRSEDSDVSESTDAVPEENVLAEEISTMIQESAARTSRATQRLVAIGQGTRVSPDRVLQHVEEGTAFELGRCEELIQHYHRIEFSTGTHRSRYDKERRKDIAKRVLSRLLPHE